MQKSQGLLESSRQCLLSKIKKNLKRRRKFNLLEASSFCLKSAISASAAANLCWDVASASLAVLTRNSKFCSSRQNFKFWTWAHALYSESLASKTSLLTGKPKKKDCKNLELHIKKLNHTKDCKISTSNYEEQ